jgi:hypothetical protein
MTPAAVLAILVATGEAHAAPTTAMAAAAAEVIGDPNGVRVVEAPALADAEALRAERELGARAVVALAWADADHLRARLRLHAARTDRWIDRELDFASGDTPAERGRTLGFAMASMLPEGDPTLPLATRQPPAPPAAPPAPLGANALEGAFAAGGGIGGPAGGLGGRVAFERFLARRASIGLSLAGRSGRIDDLDAPIVTASAGLGGALWAIAPARDQRFGLALRAEALLIYEAIEHTDAAGATAWKGQALPGGALSLSGTLRIAGPLELVATARAEVAFGTVDVTVLAARPAGGTARIPAARALGEAGLRVRF